MQCSCSSVIQTVGRYGVRHPQLGDLKAFLNRDADADAEASLLAPFTYRRDWKKEAALSLLSIDYYYCQVS